MTIENFHNKAWQETLLRLHQEMMAEKEVYEKLAKENELEGKALDEFFSYHRGLEDKKATDPADID